MSRLDYVTIAIVAVCVAALIYLVYMTTNLLGGTPRDEAVANPSALEQEDSYTGTEEYYPEDTTAAFEDSYPDQGEPASDEGYDSGKAPAYEDATNEAQSSGGEAKAAAEDPKADYASVATGQYMVLAGTFKYKGNAENMVRQLRSMGYSGASVELFDRGAFAVALVDRFDGLKDAQALKAELTSKGIEAYVKQK